MSLQNKKTKESIMRKLLITITCIIFLVFWANLTYGVVSGNGSERGYEGGGGGGGGDGNTSEGKDIDGNPVIRNLLILGAGHFLKSHSDFQMFLNKIEFAEINGTNFDELRNILVGAINSMESSKNSYFDLKTVAFETPYNQSVIDLLKNFAYDAFTYGKDLNWQVFEKLKGFLINGDITGTYVKIHADTVEILELLCAVKQSVDSEIFPDIKDLWLLNQKYSNSLFFGQYLAMIFESIAAN